MLAVLVVRTSVKRFMRPTAAGVAASVSVPAAALHEEVVDLQTLPLTLEPLLDLVRHRIQWRGYRGLDGSGAPSLKVSGGASHHTESRVSISKPRDDVRHWPLDSYFLKKSGPLSLVETRLRWSISKKDHTLEELLISPPAARAFMHVMLGFSSTNTPTIVAPLSTDTP